MIIFWAALQLLHPEKWTHRHAGASERLHLKNCFFRRLPPPSGPWVKRQDRDRGFRCFWALGFDSVSWFTLHVPRLLNMAKIGSFETSSVSYPATQRHTPKELNPLVLVLQECQTSRLRLEASWNQPMCDNWFLPNRLGAVVLKM